MKLARILTFITLLGATASAEELKGIVLGRDGSPLAGEEVRLCAAEVLSPTPSVYDTTTSDQAGNFTVAVPKRWLSYPEMWRQALSLSVVSDEHGVGAASVSGYLPLPQQRIAVRLKEWTRRTITVKTDDGKPVAGCEVKLSMLRSQTEAGGRVPAGTYLQAVIPEGPWQSSAVSDDAGRVELLLPPTKDIGGMNVQVDDNTRVDWVQYSNADSAEDWFTDLKLPKLESIPVNFEFESALRDIKLQVTSMQQTTSVGQAMVSVQTDCTPDKDGRSKAKVSPNSYVMLRNANTEAKGHLLNLSAAPMMTNSLDKIDIKYGAGTKLTAQVVDGNRKPAANIKVMFFAGYGAKTVTTDADGRITAVVSPGQLMLVPAGDSGYRLKDLSLQSAIVIPANKKEFDAGSVVVAKQSKFVGMVKNEDGTPAADATVFADWMATERTAANGQAIQSQQKRRLKTDDDGRFEIVGLDAGQKIRVGVWSGDAATEELQSFEVADTPKPETLRISKSSMTYVFGRIVAHGGKPAAGIKVQLRHRIEAPLSDPQLPAGTDIDLDLTTDAKGEYKSKTALPPWGEYVAVIHPATKREIYSGWKPARAPSVELPEFREGFSQKIMGSVVNANGQPIEGARVSLLTSNDQTEVITESDGWFQLDQTSGNAPAIIAEAEGYLANGIFLQSEPIAARIELKLVQPNQVGPQQSAIAKVANTADGPSQERQQLALELAEKYDSVDQQIKDRINSTLARYLPDAMLKRLDSLPAIESQSGQMIRSSLARGLAKDHPEKARELINDIPQGPGRFFAFKTFEESAELPDDVRLELLAQMVQDIRAMENPPYRVVSMGFVAERLMDVGQRETGEQLLRESFEDAKKLAPAAWPAYARGAFAEEMAQIDPAAAMELIEPIKDIGEYNRHLQNAAHELAATDPETAEAWLGKFREDKDGLIVDARDGAVIRCCYRMIRVDPDRALKLARSIGSSSIRIYGFTVMAESLLAKEEVTDDDRALARKVHDEAWEIVAKVRAEEDLSEVAWLYPSTMAAMLCNVTEQVAPEQLSHRIWQTIALRRPMQKSGNYRAAGQGCVCDTALLLSGVDREMAKQLTNWLPSAESGSSYALFAQVSRNAPTLLAELSPDVPKDVEAALTSLPDNQRNYVLMNIVGALVRTGEPRDRKIRGNMGLWYPDDEDHVQVD